MILAPLSDDAAVGEDGYVWRKTGPSTWERTSGVAAMFPDDVEDAIASRRVELAVSEASVAIARAFDSLMGDR